MNRPSLAGVYARLTATMFFWGGTWVSARMLAQHMGPFSAAFLRFFCASAALLVLACRVEGRLPRPPKGHWPGVLLLGASGIFFYNIFFFSGLKTVSAGRAALIVAAIPAAMALISRLVFKERLGPLRMLGVVLSFLGVAVVLSHGDPLALLSQGLSSGDIFILGCVAAWTTYSMAGPRVMRNLSPLSAVTWSCLAGTAMLLPPALAAGLAGDLARAGLEDWANILYLGLLGTALSFTWYYRGIKALGATRAGVFINLVPVFAIALGSLILAEPVGLSLLAGGAMVLIGVRLANRKAGTGPEAA